MTQQGNGDDKPQLKVSDLNNKPQRTTTGGGIRQYMNLIVIVIVGVVIVAAIFLTRSPQPVDTSTQAAASNTPAEVGTIQALETERALLVTSTVDPNVSELQTQNAQLIQDATNQAATNEAFVAQPTDTPIVIQPTQIVQPTQPPVIITATPQPTRPPTRQPTAQPTSAPADRCPTSPSEVADLIGGDASSWSLLPGTNGTGWKYATGSDAVTMTAPSFGRVDYWNSTSPNLSIRNGQQALNVTEATFWCGG